MKLYLPNPQLLEKSNVEDPVEYYYRPLTGPFYRRRLGMAAHLLENGAFGHLLEIGYGCGIFLPTLSACANRISGIDLHTNVLPVRKMLVEENIRADLWPCDVLNISVRDQEFDAVVCLSVLEHLTENQLPRALTEIARVSRPQATIVFGFPCRNVLTDAFYRLVGYDPRTIHPSGHVEILRAIRATSQLQVVKISKFFTFLPAWLNVYMVCQCIRL